VKEDLQGVLWYLFASRQYRKKLLQLRVFGIPPSATKEAVIADVEAETGVRPVWLISRMANSLLLFI
jgi:hypothetical protein